MTVKDQQVRWLEEIYPTFERVAQAIIVESVTLAEEAVSSATEQIMITINANHCRARTLGQFAAWCRRLIRGHAMKTYRKYEGDVRIDVGRRHVAAYMRPDRRQTSVLAGDEGDPERDPYTRWETIQEVGGVISTSSE